VLIAKVYEDGYSKELMLLIKNGFVVKRYNYIDTNICREYECLDLSRSGLLLPGFIDIHVHLRGLGLSYKEDEESGTKAAIHSGFTVVIDMPNTVPRIDNVYALELKLEALKNRSYVDFGIYVAPSRDEEELKRMLLSEGVVGVKIFPQDLEQVDKVVNVMRRIDDRVEKFVVVHAEDPLMLEDCEEGYRSICRPIESEISTLDRLRLFANQGIRIHITHVTNVLTLILAKHYGFTVDTCPHYVYLDSAHERDMKCLAKVNPPLRSYTTRIILSKYLKLFDAISSDHAPHSVDEKDKDFNECPSGIASLDIVGSLVLNMVSMNLIELDDVVKLLSRGPAKIVGLRRWGCFYEGCIASYTVVDLDKEVRVDPQKFFSKSKFSPYRSTKLKGVIRATIVRGFLVYNENGVVEKIEPLPITFFTRSK
jgi:dihydroorotase